MAGGWWRVDLHFVRCIKPNGAKQRDLFEPFEVLRQLRCAHTPTPTPLSIEAHTRARTPSWCGRAAPYPTPPPNYAVARCAGLMECVRIRRDGYPVRLPFPHFYRRYPTHRPPHLAEEDDHRGG
jgi:hypothetical protein